MKIGTKEAREGERVRLRNPWSNCFRDQVLDDLWECEWCCGLYVKKSQNVRLHNKPYCSVFYWTCI